MTVASGIESVFREGREAHVAVISARGPHVTPELYSWSGGRLWFWFAHTTLKARVLRASPAAAAIVSAGDRSAIVEGTVDLVDLGRPSTLLGSPMRGLRVAGGVATYVGRNAVDLGAFVRDAGTAQLGWRPPPRRVLASLSPESSLLVEAGRITGSAGRFNLPAERDPDLPPRPGGERVVVALPGPTVVPGRWFLDDAEVWIDPHLLDAAGVTGTTPIAVVADEYVAPGPAAKLGALVRGAAHRDGDTGSLAVDAATLTTWNGIDAETTAAPQ